MKRTTIYLEPDLEIRLKIEAMRAKKPMAEIIREALRELFGTQSRHPPLGVGEFEGWGPADLSERDEEYLAQLGFGEEDDEESGPRR